MSVTETLRNRYKKPDGQRLTVDQWLELARDDASAYASPAERLLRAIGEPKRIDTSEDPVLSRIFHNRVIMQYEPFKDFFGLEEGIQRFVDYVKHSAQGLEESKQICYFLGPVGGGKSSLVERIKGLFEKESFWAIEGSPVHDSPLYLFNSPDLAEQISADYGIPLERFKYKPSPWLIKRLEESEGDLSQFKIVKITPSKNRQIAISRTEPGDPNNQDTSTLVGKVDIRKIDKFSQNDPDAYLYSGGLCLGNRGCMEFVEMFKAPLPMLNPLLTATQDGYYNGTEAVSGLPFEGMILAHSNESEWSTFKNNPTNEAFLDRVYLIRVPYCLRTTEEAKIFRKILSSSTLKDAPCAPKTLDMLAEFSVLSRLKKVSNIDPTIKMRVYNGESLKDKEPSAKSVHDFRELAGVTEGMDGLSTRFTFKVLSKTFNYDPEELGANPVHLMAVLQNLIVQEQFSKDKEEEYLSYIDKYLKPQYLEFLEKEIQKAYFDTYSEYGQNVHDQYFMYADMWLAGNEWRDPNTGIILDLDELDKELMKIERPANIANAKSFRNDFVMFVHRHKNLHDGKMPSWESYSKMKEVIEKKLHLSANEILPIISFSGKKQKEDEKRHKKFVDSMRALGYTERQTRICVEYFSKASKS